MSGTSIDPERFKNMMANVAASVTVVTAPSDDGPVGITVSAFTSVSADPPIVLVCIDKVAGSLESLLGAEGFTVNFMPEGTEDTAMVFAMTQIMVVRQVSMLVAWSMRRVMATEGI